MKKNKINKLIIFEIVAGIIIFGLYYYITLPVLNIHAAEFWSLSFFVLIYALICVAINTSTKLISSFNGPQGTEINFNKEGFTLPMKIILSLLVICIVVPFLWAGISAPFFNANEYSQRIDMKEVDFSEIPEIDANKTPIIDRESTIRLGDKVMGQMPELVSQFNVSEEYTQISYKDAVYRVTPLEYASFIKYFKNRGEGIPAYIRVNSTTGKAELVKLKDLGFDNMKYTPSAYFNENLMRKLRFKYPTQIFGSPSFEVDEKGHPYYICTTYTYKGVNTKKTVTGVIVFNPIDGTSKKYGLKDIPNWVDRVYPEDLLITQIDDHGRYQKGFFNSIIGQEGVIVTSEGYNYIEKDGDIWLYSGLTSATKDAANLGFVLVNTRTHESLKISTPGANETSAMSSAEGEVKNYGYKSTFPLLVNIKGNPVYLMSLKDDAGLIKMYATVSAIDYQKVTVVSADEGIKELIDKTLISFGDNNVIDDKKLIAKDIIVSNVEKVLVNDTTMYYILSSENEKFKIKFDTKYEDKLVFLKSGDVLKIKYVSGEAYNTIKKIS